MFVGNTARLAERFTLGDYDGLFASTKFDVGTCENCICRMLYWPRSTKENPVSIRESNSVSFVDNTVLVVSVDNWFQCDGLKKDGKEVKEAFALKKVGVEARAFIKEDIRSGVIAIMRPIRMEFTMLLPKVTPWFFKETPLTDWEIDMLKRCSASRAATTEKIREFISQFNLAEKVIRFESSEFMKKLLDNKLHDLVLKESRLLEAMRDLETKMREIQKTYTETNQRIIGIKASHDEGVVPEFINAIWSNPNCNIDHFQNETIVFTVCGHLTNFSKTAYEAISRSENSCLYERIGIPKKYAHKLYDELMLGKRYRLNLCGRFILNLTDNTISLVRTYDECIHDNAMSNPHIAQYGCAGGFMQLFNEALRDGDYMEVLDIAFSEVQNLNWTDYSPVRQFSSWLFNSCYDRACVWDKEKKKYISPKEVLNSIYEEDRDDS